MFVLSSPQGVNCDIVYISSWVGRRGVGESLAAESWPDVVGSFDLNSEFGCARPFAVAGNTAQFDSSRV